MFWRLTSALLKANLLHAGAYAADLPPSFESPHTGPSEPRLPNQVVDFVGCWLLFSWQRRISFVREILRCAQDDVAVASCSGFSGRPILVVASFRFAQDGGYWLDSRSRPADVKPLTIDGSGFAARP